MKPSSQRTGIVILHYSNLENVRDCLRSIQASKDAQTFCPIVVSNGAKTSARPLETEFGDWIKLIELQKNLGYTGGNNVGMEWAGENLAGPIVFLLNDDTFVAPDTLVSLRKTMLDQPKLGALCPLIYFTKGREFHPGYEPNELGKVIWYNGGVVDWTEVVGFHQSVDEVDRTQTASHTTDFATGCCVALRWDALHQTGLLDKKAFLYWEDVDLSYRIRAAGWDIAVSTEAHLWHHNAGSSSGSGSKLQVYYQTRNRFWFGWKYGRLRTKLFLARHAIRLLRTGSPEEKRGILDWLQGHYGQNASLHT